MVVMSRGTCRGWQMSQGWKRANVSPLFGKGERKNQGITVLTVFSLWKNTRTHQKPACGSLGGSGERGTSPLASVRSYRGETAAVLRAGVQPQLSVGTGWGPAQAAPSWGWPGPGCGESPGFCDNPSISRLTGDLGLPVRRQGNAAAGSGEAHPAATSALRFNRQLERVPLCRGPAPDAHGGNASRSLARNGVSCPATCSSQGRPRGSGSPACGHR